MFRRMVHAVQASLMRFFRLLSRVLPSGCAAPMGRLTGLVIFRCIGPLRERVRGHLRAAFPERSPAEIDALLWRTVRNAGEVQMSHMMASRRGFEKRFCDIQGQDATLVALREMQARGRGLVLVTGHMSNWELMLSMIAAHMEFHAVTARLYFPYEDRLMMMLREEIYRYGCIFVKKARQQIGPVLARNGCVVFVSDVQVGQRGLFVPFLLRPMAMGRGPAHYAIKHRAPVAFVIPYRDETGRMHVAHEEIQWEAGGDTEEEVYRLTAEIASRFERWVRRYPDQWFGWLWQPWKNRPLEELEAGLRQSPADLNLLQEATEAWMTREDRARMHLQEALKVDPDCWFAHRELGRLALEAGEDEGASFHLDRALALNPRDSITLKWMGQRLLGTGRCEEALECFNRSLKRKYDDPETYLGRGACLERMGRLRAARACFKRGLWIDPDSVPLHEALEKLETSP